jgi:hypothetical protein
MQKDDRLAISLKSFQNKFQEAAGKIRSLSRFFFSYKLFLLIQTDLISMSWDDPFALLLVTFLPPASFIGAKFGYKKNPPTTLVDRKKRRKLAYFLSSNLLHMVLSNEISLYPESRGPTEAVPLNLPPPPVIHKFLMRPLLSISPGASWIEGAGRSLLKIDQLVTGPLSHVAGGSFKGTVHRDSRGSSGINYRGNRAGISH